jgi:hypothetical protein
MKAKAPNTDLYKLFPHDHIYNVSAVERKAGIRRLKLHEALAGVTKLTTCEVSEIQRVMKNFQNFS